MNDMFGISGTFCWIKQSMNSNCKYDYVGLTLMFVLQYGPEVLVCMVAFTSLGAIAIVMCRRATKQEHGTRHPSINQQGLKEVLPLLLYPLVYLLLWAIPIALRINDVVLSAQDRTPLQFEWLGYSIILNVRRVFVPLVCLVHLSIVCYRKKQTRQYAQLNTTTSFVVSKGFTDQEDAPLIIKGQGTKIPSKKYESVLEGSEK